MTFMRYEKPQLKPEINSFLREGPINLLNPSHMPQLDHKINWSVTRFKSTKSLPIHAKCILPELASLTPLPLHSTSSTPKNETNQSLLIHLSPDRHQSHSPFTDWLGWDVSTHIFLSCLLRYKTAGVLPRGKLIYLWFSPWSHRHTEIIQVPDENFRIIGSGSQEITL